MPSAPFLTVCAPQSTKVMHYRSPKKFDNDVFWYSLKDKLNWFPSFIKGILYFKTILPENEGLALDQDFEESWDLKIFLKIVSNSYFKTLFYIGETFFLNICKDLKLFFGLCLFQRRRHKKFYCPPECGGDSLGLALKQIRIEIQIKNFKQHYH